MTVSTEPATAPIAGTALLRRALGALGVAIYRLGLARLVVRLSPHRVRALLYHAVEPSSSSLTAGLGVTIAPATLAAHLDLCARLYDVVTPAALAGPREPSKRAGPTRASGPPARSAPPRRTRRARRTHRPRLVLTFDDGYASVHRHAAPLLIERGLPACVYLIGRAVEGRLVWVNLLNHALVAHPAEAMAAAGAFDAALRDLDTRADIVGRVRDHWEPTRIEGLCAALTAAIPALADLDGRELYLSPAQVRELHAGGIESGFHTVDHYSLVHCDDAELERQLDASRLDGLLTCDTFAYPFGYYDARVAKRAHGTMAGHIMTVADDDDPDGTRHLDRVEVFSPDPARLFAALEVVEPVLGWLRRRAGRAPAHAGAPTVT